MVKPESMGVSRHSKRPPARVEVNEKLADICNVLVLLAGLVSAGNAMVRYAYDNSSNAWLELQWYMFAIIIMFGASYTLKKNEHVRVDILYMMMTPRQQLWRVEPRQFPCENSLEDGGEVPIG